MLESTAASAPPDWATWTPAKAPEDEGNAAYQKRCAMSAGSGRGSASPRGRGLRGGRAGSHMTPAIAHQSTTVASYGSCVKTSAGPTTTGFDAEQPELAACNSLLESGMRPSDIKRPSPTTVTVGKPSDKQHHNLRKTRICTSYAEKQFCPKRDCWFAHIGGEDAVLILAEANANRPCPLIHPNGTHLVNCAFKHNTVGSDVSSTDLVLASDAEASESSVTTLGDHDVKPSFWKSRQCNNYRQEQKCPTHDCIFAHVVGDDAGFILSLVRRHRACPFKHKEDSHILTCGYRHDKPNDHQIMMADHSMPASQDVDTGQTREQGVHHTNDAYAVSEPSERGCHIQAGTIDPEIAISQIVLCALVLLWATFAGI